jgi:hypothetical protein
MRWYRFLPFVLTAVGGVLLTGALRGPGALEEKVPLGRIAPAGLAQVVPDAAATEVMTQAVRRLQPSSLGWLQAGVWLRARLPGVRYEGEGRYVLAPGQRFRLELQMRRTGGKRRTTTVLSVSDGRDLWLARDAGDGTWTDVQRLQVGAILTGADSPVRLPALRDQFLQGQALRGLVPLMRSLQTDLRWLRREGGAGEEVLTGTWDPGLAAVLAPPGQPWPEGLPRVCRLVLRGPELWPARIEWYGSPDAAGQMPLLVEMEFRDPLFNQRLPEDQAAGLFAFDPGQAVVTDLTAQVLAGLRASAEALQRSAGSGQRSGIRRLEGTSPLRASDR